MFVRGKAVDMWYVLEAPRGMELASDACPTARAGRAANAPCRVGLLVLLQCCIILRHLITVLFLFCLRTSHGVGLSVVMSTMDGGSPGHRLFLLLSADNFSRHGSFFVFLHVVSRVFFLPRFDVPQDQGSLDRAGPNEDVADIGHEGMVLLLLKVHY